MDQVIDLLPLVIIRWEGKKGRVPKDLGRERMAKEERRNPFPLALGQWTLHLQKTGRRVWNPDTETRNFWGTGWESLTNWCWLEIPFDSATCSPPS